MTTIQHPQHNADLVTNRINAMCHG